MSWAKIGQYFDIDAYPVFDVSWKIFISIWVTTIEVLLVICQHFDNILELDYFSK